MEIFWGWEWGGGVLHKLSSRSACIAWPTVQKGEWNVGQTPPPLSFSVSVCILFFFFLLSQTSQHRGCFEYREECVVLVVSLCFVLLNQSIITEKNISLACVVKAVFTHTQPLSTAGLNQCCLSIW